MGIVFIVFAELSVTFFQKCSELPPKMARHRPKLGFVTPRGYHSGLLVNVLYFLIHWCLEWCFVPLYCVGGQFALLGSNGGKSIIQ